MSSHGTQSSQYSHEPVSNASPTSAQTWSWRPDSLARSNSAPDYFSQLHDGHPAYMMPRRCSEADATSSSNSRFYDPLEPSYSYIGSPESSSRVRSGVKVSGYLTAGAATLSRHPSTFVGGSAEKLDRWLNDVDPTGALSLDGGKFAPYVFATTRCDPPPNLRRMQSFTDDGSSEYRPSVELPRLSNAETYEGLADPEGALLDMYCRVGTECGYLDEELKDIKSKGSYMWNQSAESCAAASLDLEQAQKRLAYIARSQGHAEKSLKDWVGETISAISQIH